MVPMRNYAHLGDAVWELFVRENIFDKAMTAKDLHKLTSNKVNASYQAHLLKLIINELSDDEQDIVRRARNCSIPIARRNIQNEYRHATSFEALIGYWYLNDKKRLEFFFDKFLTIDEFI